MHLAYIVLQKPAGVMDVYNITAMIEHMETHNQDPLIAMEVSLGMQAYEDFGLFPQQQNIH